MDTVPEARQRSPTPVGLSRSVCSLAECSLGFTYVCMDVVDDIRDVIDGSTLVFFRCFVSKVYYHRAEGCTHLRQLSSKVS